MQWMNASRIYFKFGKGYNKFLFVQIIIVLRFNLSQIHLKLSEGVSDHGLDHLWEEQHSLQ